MTWTLRLGTRSSLLALTQATLAQKYMETMGQNQIEGGVSVELKTYTTSGDRLFDARLESFGGKGLFIKEIEMALLNGEIDLAIHSVKDLPVQVTPGLVFAAFLEREDPRDVLIAQKGLSAENLPINALIGTSSLRRKVQLLQKRPDFRMVPFRGNIDTRMKKLEDGVVMATVLAAAGLNRIQRWPENYKILSVDEMLPAVGQGALVLQCREDDVELYSFLRTLNHAETEIAIIAERAFSAAVFGACNTPVAGYAFTKDDGALRLKGLISTLEGDHIESAEIEGPSASAHTLGDTLGQTLKPFIEKWRACGSL